MAGDTSLDCELLVDKLKKLFNIELLMLGGGGVLNWSFIQAGLCDEVSLVVAASADGSTKTPTLFMEKEGLSKDKPVHFKLQDVKIMDGDSLWLRYTVKK
ncbi:dihydrofolate reductase family protein [Intestinibacter sp.]|uniref:dihydrofolate reductase family protein n=1 Tax=Intestinibacter sp. TaxID=1965304 RepID=UPI0025F3AF32|nr:dihydrofolate reductase family protein [uncultured Intestinibacter sp.]